ncbi:unnamed protein product [Cuscuta epithymum]|uniref:Uncharacterized protein n=1 Tax=Cuscuta epithymum TaxID=186058 RepID=A0AAV0FLE6_9ASTE|nr:unnamed protein product [Cuscuta epithymum]
MLDALVASVAHDLEGVPDVDDEGALDGRDVGPSVVFELAHVEPTDVILKEEGEGGDVRVAANSDREVGVGALGVVVDVDPTGAHEERSCGVVDFIDID